MADVLGIEGKVAIVTGGGGNIGSATVRLLAQAGAKVLVADIDGSKAERAAKAVTDGGGDAVALQSDVSAPDQVTAMVDHALARWDRLDFGINIVGGGSAGQGKTSLELTDEEWLSSIETNLMTAVRCSRLYANTMIDRKTAGSIVNIASPAALRAAPNLGAYGASKAALINFTWSLAVDVAPHGIRANVVIPAFVTQPGMTWGGSEEQQAELARRTVPMGRVTRAEDVGGAILAFCSDLTSYSTGQIIVCDGGRLLTNPINTGLSS
jgi:NAD(P)-dependent dehydrogenase (short-subunit alcohol dehydrogenase family)